MVVSVQLIEGEHRLAGDWAGLEVANGFPGSSAGAGVLRGRRPGVVRVPLPVTLHCMQSQ
jgi:hypothetical protein